MEYCRNKTHSEALYAENEIELEQIQKLLNQSLSLSSFLIKPVQRYERVPGAGRVPGSERRAGPKIWVGPQGRVGPGAERDNIIRQMGLLFPSVR